MPNAGTILVVEDNPTTAKTLIVFLESEGYVAVHARTGREGEALFRDRAFDLVLLDVMLPDLDGLAICRSIRARAATPIVMLTARTAEDHIVAGLEAGADDYVCKPFGSRELLARIRRCLGRARTRHDARCVLRVGAIELDPDRRIVTVRNDAVSLTRSEFDLLHLMMRNPGRVFTRTQLIEQALGPDFGGLERTVDTHIWSLRKKIGEPRGRPDYLVSELGVGYRMSEPHAS